MTEYWYALVAFCLGYLACIWATRKSIKQIQFQSFIRGAEALKKEIEDQIKQHQAKE